MKYILVKDYKRRKVYETLFFKRKKSTIFLRDQCLLRSNLYKKNNIKKAYKTLASFQYSSLSKIRNRCYFSGKGRAVFRRHKMSRIPMREALRTPIIYGLRKACW
jgi:succinate dehydrogenase (ubiquinone) iron-sulfur subunit